MMIGSNLKSNFNEEKINFHTFVTVDNILILFVCIKSSLWFINDYIILQIIIRNCHHESKSKNWTKIYIKQYINTHTSFLIDDSTFNSELSISSNALYFLDFSIQPRHKQKTLSLLCTTVTSCLFVINRNGYSQNIFHIIFFFDSTANKRIYVKNEMEKIVFNNWIFEQWRVFNRNM